MCDIWNALSAIGTCAAVGVSLWLAQRDRKRVRKLEIHQYCPLCHGDGIIKLIITIENIGNIPIIINEYGRLSNNKISILYDINQYLVNPYEPILIKANEAKVIEYQHCLGYSIDDFNILKVKNSSEYKLFSTAIFVANDTLGNRYQRKISGDKVSL